MTSGRTLNPISIAAVNAIHASRVEDLQCLRAANAERPAGRPCGYQRRGRRLSPAEHHRAGDFVVARRVTRRSVSMLHSQAV